MSSSDVHSEKTTQAIHDLISSCGGNIKTFDGELITQLIQNSLKLLFEKHDTGQLKLMTRTMKEMRYAYRIFNRFPHAKRVSVFGSARTPEDHPDYLAAKAFSIAMVKLNWICITGAAHGIMKAGLEGHEQDPGFGLAIKLPFESTVNPLIEGKSNHITFHYFFTRKLMFLSHSQAIAAFPGGFGTMDELFEVLTLMQTGKANIIPVVLIEGEKRDYWENWENFIQSQFLDKGWISPEDRSFYYIAKGPRDAVDHIQQFYARYHSSRYVKEHWVIRLKTQLNAEQIAQLNAKYVHLFHTGLITACLPYPEEKDHLDLPRLTFQHNRFHLGAIRQLIDDINSFN